jgi:asparagine synthase (glutamine-hydrolysing)
MCGIVGYRATHKAAGDHLRTIERMLSLVGHRGPDGAGYCVSGRTALGTARLSVVDPDGGVQPMSDPAGRYRLCYNGEVYNFEELRAELEHRGHRFRSRSDTEVVLRGWMEWGAACLPRFNGAFAFALLDTGTDVLYLARDRFGKRPLFYTERGGDVIFGSEVKSLIGFRGWRPQLDPRMLAAIYGTWTPLTHQTAFADVRQVPAGSYIAVGERCSEPIPYRASLFDADPPEGVEAEAAARVRDAVASSVRLRLRGDSELGVYLSGGLDSTVIAAVAASQATAPLKTFSVQFEDPEFDESDYQQLVVTRLGTDHRAIRISHRAIAEALPDALYHAETPAFRTAFVPMFLLSRLARESGVKAVLTGEGADEAFLGYNLFKDTLLRVAWNDLSTEDRKARLAGMYPYLGHFGEGNETHLLGLYQQYQTERLPGLFSHEIRFQNGRFAARLLKERIDPFADLQALTRTDPAFSAMDPVQRAQWLEYRTLLEGYLLSTQGERMSFAHGVENRCPYLDGAVVSAARASNLRFDDGTIEKYMLKQAFANEVPEPIRARPKHPYRAPDAVALISTRPPYLDLVASEHELGQVDFLDRKFAARLVSKVMSAQPGDIAIRENQAFLFLVSTVLLHRDFAARAEATMRSGWLKPLPVAQPAMQA